MDDPRLNDGHLSSPRREQYLHARDKLFSSIGQTTGDVEKAIQAQRLPFGFVPQPAQYALRDMRCGRLHLMRVGINTIGRHEDNDIVLAANPISRRHCVIVIHASGRVEVRDTASRHGVRLGCQPVGNAEMAPGDILRLCDYKFMLLAFSPEWRTDTVIALAQQMYESRDFSALPILADALQDAGCDSPEILDHCRNPGPHTHGSWIVDLVLGKE
jgi:hypothetical protein